MTRLAIIGDAHVRLPKNEESVEYIEDTKRYEMLKEALIKGNYDFIVFSGDLFDKARPSLEEIQYVTSFVKDFKNVILIDGNHEAVTKNTSTYDYINIPNTVYYPYGRLLIEDVSITTLGYKRLRDYLYTAKADILISHFRSNLGIIKEEVPVKDIAKRYKDVILGDIHQMYNPLSNVHYTSSPYGLHYQSKVEKYGYIELTINKAEYAINRVELKLPNKIKVSLPYNKAVDLLNAELTDRYVLEVEGTLQELKSLPENRLVRVIPKLKTVDVTKPITRSKNTDLVQSLVTYIPTSNTDEATKILEHIMKEVA